MRATGRAYGVLVVSVLLALASAEAAAAVPLSVSRSEDGLQYMRFDASSAEWQRTFPESPHAQGPVHAWARCVGRDVRVAFALEALDMRLPELGQTGFTPREDPLTGKAVNMSHLQFVVDDALVQPVADGGEAYVREFGFAFLGGRSFVTVAVRNWRRTQALRADGCVAPRNTTATAPRLVVSANAYDSGDAAYAEGATFALALEKHARFHLRMFDEYEAWVDNALYEACIRRPFLARRVHFVLKSNTLPVVRGESVRYHPVYNSLALLRRWREHTPSRVLLCDLDEFLLLPPPRVRGLRQLVASAAVLRLERRNRVCADCPPGPDIDVERPEQHTWLPLLKTERPKVIADPDVAGCHWVHWVQCRAGGGPRPAAIRVPYDEAFMAHFPNFWRQRAQQGEGLVEVHHPYTSWRAWPRAEGADDDARPEEGPDATAAAWAVET